MEYMRLTWDQIEEMVENVCKQIIEKKFFPNYIIALGRGGLIPARLVSDRLGINDIGFINVKLYKNVGVKNKEITIKNFNDIIENKNILLIDDIADSGETIEKTIKHLLCTRYKTLKTAVLLIRESIVRKPSFFDRVVKKEWIVFPWEKEEFKECKNDKSEKNKEISNIEEQKLLIDKEIDKILDEE